METKYIDFIGFTFDPRILEEAKKVASPPETFGTLVYNLVQIPEERRADFNECFSTVYKNINGDELPSFHEPIFHALSKGRLNIPEIITSLRGDSLFEMISQGMGSFPFTHDRRVMRLFNQVEGKYAWDATQQILDSFGEAPTELYPQIIDFFKGNRPGQNKKSTSAVFRVLALKFIDKEDWRQLTVASRQLGIDVIGLLELAGQGLINPGWSSLPSYWAIKGAPC